MNVMNLVAAERSRKSLEIYNFILIPVIAE
jgi:hypothetical protein